MQTVSIAYLTVEGAPLLPSYIQDKPAAPHEPQLLPTHKKASSKWGYQVSCLQKICFPPLASGLWLSSVIRCVTILLCSFTQWDLSEVPD